MFLSALVFHSHGNPARALERDATLSTVPSVFDHSTGVCLFNQQAWQPLVDLSLLNGRPPSARPLWCVQKTLTHGPLRWRGFCFALLLVERRKILRINMRQEKRKLNVSVGVGLAQSP